MRMDMKIGMGMMWLLIRMKRPHILCGLSKYADYLSASTTNYNHLLPYDIHDYDTLFHTELTVACYSILPLIATCYDFLQCAQDCSY